MAKKRGAEPKFPEKPDIGYRSPNAIIAEGEAIVKPKDAGEEFQYEAELVAVIGKTARNVPREKALDYVFGWTIGNDVSERAWQRGDRTMWRGKDTRHVQADGAVDRHRRRLQEDAARSCASTARRSRISPPAT